MTHDELQVMFEHGIRMARDPRNGNIQDGQKSRVTTIYSHWLLQTCRVCHHSFRKDDYVRPEPTQLQANWQRMLHEDPHTSLLCWSKAQGFTQIPSTSVSLDATLQVAFLRGLRVSWNPTTDVVTELVQARSRLILRRCPICRHTVRPGDEVVRCPCGRNCGGVFHQDLTRHLTCWDTWNRGSHHRYCAFTGAPFVDEQPGASQ